jgi:hypothetical protein
LGSKEDLVKMSPRMPTASFTSLEKQRAEDGDEGTSKVEV